MIPEFAKISDHAIQKLLDTASFLESDVIDGKEAKRRFRLYAKCTFQAPNSNKRLILHKIRRNIDCIIECKKKYNYCSHCDGMGWEPALNPMSPEEPCTKCGGAN
jgi:hypothetical protein